MRKYLALLAVACGLLIPAAAIAATLDTSKFTGLIAAGDACSPPNSGAWYHFVVNQIGTDNLAGVTVTATFDTPDTETVGPTAVNKSTQHFYIWDEGTLLSAVTGGPNLGPNAKIVLSHISCGKKTDDPTTLPEVEA